MNCCLWLLSSSLRENCPNGEFFLIRIFLHSDWMRRDTPYLSVFSLNAGKYGPEKTPYLDNFHAVHFLEIMKTIWRKAVEPFALSNSVLSFFLSFFFFFKKKIWVEFYFFKKDFLDNLVNISRKLVMSKLRDALQISPLILRQFKRIN